MHPSVAAASPTIAELRVDARATGLALIGSAVLAGAASIGLAVSFGWPAVLDEPAATALPAFAAAETAVRFWFIGQLAGSLALVPAVFGLQALLTQSRRAGAGLRALTAFGLAAVMVHRLGPLAAGGSRSRRRLP